MRKMSYRFFLFLLMILPLFLYRSDAFEPTYFEGRRSLQIVREVTDHDPYLTMLRDSLHNMALLKQFWEKRNDKITSEYYNLVISLQDSLISLDLKDITIHQAKIAAYNLSADLGKKRDSKDIFTWLAQNFYLSEQWANTPKEPIRKIDISSNRDLLDSLSFLPVDSLGINVFILLKFSNRLSVTIREVYDNNSEIQKLSRQSDASEESTFAVRGDTFNYPLKDLLDEDWITVELSRADAISIYRALHTGSELILGL
jgi:hypothetical protein